ncbi:hypothetical protein FHS43_003274 [Streptosporangium becharense]|uniref:Zinc ribbon domain-containing protein n=1 Tax=Streptosporangium becharense TaxID=1816182 RepID=A0A7W9IE03_9ACTN|nr:S1C family serine protease [Streptosporangium becharense]MBB2911994.1 hypothetical protein [Streptosporangium becharense]MBB5818541.1 hypothetical protein [Streptosporangium becharense]
MRRFGPALVVAGGLCLAVTAVAPALAHEHPSGITDLVTPAVVRIEATAKIDVTLLDHLGELMHVERSYEVPVGVGSGTVVSPEGGIVTLTGVVKSDRDMRIHAANKIFAEHFKVDIPGDFERHSVKDDQLNRHLQQCYPPKVPTATCIFDVTTEIKVFPNILPPDKEGFTAEIAHTGSTPDTPAVLKVTGHADGGAGLPTAPLAAGVPSKEGSPVAVAGFTGRPAANLKETVDIAHLRAGGSGEGGRGFKDPENKVDEPRKIGALVDRGLRGGPVIEDKKGEVVGLLIGGGGDARMIGVREVTKALGEAGVVPRRGPIDVAFEQALTRFHTKYYGDAVPAFQRVLELYPGHTVAAAHLKTSQEKRGTAEDEGVKAAVPRDTRALIPLWPFLAGGALVLAVLGITVLLWRRRSAGPEPEAEQPVPVGAHPSAPPGAPPPMPRRPAFDEKADPTIVVGRSFPSLPKVSTSPGQPVLVAREADAKPVETPVQKYCTGCGMRLGPAHSFCGFCGQSAKA